MFKILFRYLAPSPWVQEERHFRYHPEDQG